MVELDRFELDLAAALRAYLEEAPTEAFPTRIAAPATETAPSFCSTRPPLTGGRLWKLTSGRAGRSARRP